MKNTINYNNKTFQNTTVSVMNDILASNVTGNSMDDVYKTVCKYANLTREQFEENYKQAEAKLNEWKNNELLNGSNCELSDDDLDMVVGGSIGSFFGAIADGISTAACAVGNFVKEHAVEIAIIAGITALGIVCGGATFAYLGFVAPEVTAATAGAVAVASGKVGAVIGAGIGMLAGYDIAYGD